MSSRNPAYAEIVQVLTHTWLQNFFCDAASGHWTVCHKLTLNWWPEWDDQREWVYPVQEDCHWNWITANWWYYSSGCTTLGWFKSLCYWAIKKNVSHWIKDTLAMNFFFFHFKLHKYDIWKEQDPWSKSSNHPCNISSHTIKLLLSARGWIIIMCVDKLSCATSVLWGS